jgi:hypothetical protein
MRFRLSPPPWFLAAAAAVLAPAATAAVTYDFNSNDGGSTSTFNTAAFDGPWGYGAGAGAGGTGGWSTEGQVAEVGHPNTTDLTSALLGVSAAGPVTLTFEHRWSFEADGTNWDGGAVFVSQNGGPFTQLPVLSFTAVPYNGTIAAGSASELKGLLGFVGQSAGYATGAFVTSVASLGPFAAGDTLRIRFRAAYDSNTSGGAPDWAIDNVALSNADPIPEPGAAALCVLGCLAFTAASRRNRSVRRR